MSPHDGSCQLRVLPTDIAALVGGPLSSPPPVVLGCASRRTRALTGRLAFSGERENLRGGLLWRRGLGDFGDQLDFYGDVEGEFGHADCGAGVLADLGAEEVDE